MNQHKESSSPNRMHTQHAPLTGSLPVSTSFATELHPCRTCGYGVRAAEENCPNCGRSNPLFSAVYQRGAFPDRDASVFIASVTLILLALVFHQLPVVSVTFVVLALALLVLALVSNHDTQNPAVPASLEHHERRLRARMDEMLDQERRIDVLNAQLSTVRSPSSRTKMQETLQAARAVINERRQQYGRKLLDLDLFRWRNRIQLIIHRLNRAREHELESCLHALMELKERGASLREGYAGLDPSAPSDLPETIDRVQNLIDLLLERVTALSVASVVSGVSSDTAADLIPIGDEELRQLEVLGVYGQLDLESFTADVWELERQHERMRLTLEDLSH